MANLYKIRDYLRELLEVDRFTDYCENGIQVEGKEEVKKIAFSVSSNLTALEKAKEAGADLFICHHGLFWHKEKGSVDKNLARKLRALLSDEISLMAYHLPLDAHNELGNNFRAAKELGWFDLASFGGIGVKGKMAPQPIEEVIHQLSTYFGQKAVSAPFGKKRVSTVAFISGGGYTYLKQAAKEGIDLFVTGNFDEPAYWIAQEEKMHFVAMGHYATERVGIKALKEHLLAHFSVEGLFIDETNPF